MPVDSPCRSRIRVLQGAYKKTTDDGAGTGAASAGGVEGRADDDGAAAALAQIITPRSVAIAPIAMHGGGGAQQFTPRLQPRPEELAAQVVAPANILASLQAAYAEVID